MDESYSTGWRDTEQWMRVTSLDGEGSYSTVDGSYSIGWSVTAHGMVSYSTWIGQIYSGTAAGRSGNIF